MSEFIITVKDDPKDGEPQAEFSCTLAAPNRGTYLAAMNKIQDNKTMEAGMLILNTCWVSGDEVIKQRDDLYMSVAMQCIELLKLKETTLKKK